jgi:hypothetical protein
MFVAVRIRIRDMARMLRGGQPPQKSRSMEKGEAKNKEAGSCARIDQSDEGLSS